MKTKKVAETKAKAPRKGRKKDPKFCVEAGCKNAAVTHGYCRGCYLKNWKLIKFDRQVKAERRLNAYIDRLSKKYPKDYLEVIKEGLEDEAKFRKSVEELNVEVEEPSETDNEFLEKFMRSLKSNE